MSSTEPSTAPSTAPSTSFSVTSVPWHQNQTYRRVFLGTFVVLFVGYSISIWGSGMTQKEHEMNQDESKKSEISDRYQVAVTFTTVLLILMLISIFIMFFMFSVQKKEICAAIAK
jgi:cytochrome c biogenesis factor